MSSVPVMWASGNPGAPESSYGNPLSKSVSMAETWKWYSPATLMNPQWTFRFPMMRR